MIEAVIFDLDGVLVTTDELHFAAWQQLAASLGIDTFTKADNIRQRGVSRMESLDVVLEKTDKPFTDIEKLALAEQKNDLYVQSLAVLSPQSTLPGASDTLAALKQRGIKVALGSASKNSSIILQRTGLAPLFDAIADGYDTSRSKPDPEVFLVAAKKLGVDPAACIVVEDADAGIAAGNAAGMQTLGVGPAAQNPAATWHAEHLADPALNWDILLR